VLFRSDPPGGSPEDSDRAAQSLSGDGAHRFHCPGTRDKGNSPKGRVVFITFRNTIMVALARNRPCDPTSQIAHQRLDRSLPGDWFLFTAPSPNFTSAKSSTTSTTEKPKPAALIPPPKPNCTSSTKRGAVAKLGQGRKAQPQDISCPCSGVLKLSRISG